MSRKSDSFVIPFPLSNTKNILPKHSKIQYFDNISSLLNQQTFEGINDNTERILMHGFPGEIISEIERLEQQNAEFNNIEGIDNLFVHLNKSDDESLDALVDEFMVEFPDFNILNYVDPALDGSLDAGIADILGTIDGDIRQPGIDINGLASTAVEERFVLSSPNQCETRFANQEPLTVPHMELQSLKSLMQQQHVVISELQEQVKMLKAINPQQSSNEMVQQVRSDAHPSRSPVNFILCCRLSK